MPHRPKELLINLSASCVGRTMEKWNECTPYGGMIQKKGVENSFSAITIMPASPKFSYETADSEIHLNLKILVASFHVIFAGPARTHIEICSREARDCEPEQGWA